MFWPEDDADDVGEQKVEDDTARKGMYYISSSLGLVFISLNPEGTNPDFRKLVELDQLNTVRNASVGGGAVMQRVFADGDTFKD
jgi:hypothetical protein